MASVIKHRTTSWATLDIFAEYGFGSPCIMTEQGYSKGLRWCICVQLKHGQFQECQKILSWHKCFLLLLALTCALIYPTLLPLASSIYCVHRSQLTPAQSTKISICPSAIVTAQTNTTIYKSHRLDVPPWQVRPEILSGTNTKCESQCNCKEWTLH